MYAFKKASAKPLSLIVNIPHLRPTASDTVFISSLSRAKNGVLFLSAKKWLFFATVSFGMGIHGKKIRIKYIPIKIFGLRKSREIWKEMKKLIKHLKMKDGQC